VVIGSKFDVQLPFVIIDTTIFNAVRGTVTGSSLGKSLPHQTIATGAWSKHIVKQPDAAKTDILAQQKNKPVRSSQCANSLFIM
jgi:hypothetical protein